MSTLRPDCPLIVYLKSRKESIPHFAARCAGVSQRTIYSFCQGRPGRCYSETLVAISVATGGDVSVNQLAAWRATMEQTI